MTAPPIGTRTVEPPEDALPRVGPQPSAKVSQRLADEAQIETARLKREEGELLTRLAAIRAELLALAAIQQAAGASYGDTP